MKQIDLIIDALEKAKDGWQSFDEYEKALAAAHEMKALKPIAWIVGLLMLALVFGFFPLLSLVML